MAFQTSNRQWSQDWFLHAASVRELSVRPLHPHHPLLGTPTSDAEYSPYALVLGLISKVTGLGVVTVVSFAGLVNLVIFLIILPAFVRCFSRQPRAPAWALLFILLLWGFK